MIALQNSRYILIQSEVKPTPTVPCSHEFSRASCQQLVITSSFD